MSHVSRRIHYLVACSNWKRKPEQWSWEHPVSQCTRLWGSCTLFPLISRCCQFCCCAGWAGRDVKAWPKIIRNYVEILQSKILLSAENRIVGFNNIVGQLDPGLSSASWILACHRKTARKVRYLKEMLVQNLSAKWTDTPRSISGT